MKSQNPKSENPGTVKVEIQAGALCQLIRVWPRENFSAIDVRCLPSADSQVSHTLHQASSRERIPRLSPARVSGCPGVRAGFLEYARLAFGGIATRAGLPAIQRSKLRAAWLREAKPDLARAFSPPICRSLSLQALSNINCS